MTEEEKIKENLCFYDKHSPYYDKDSGPRKKNCYCDNCFYGRTPMAEKLLELFDIFKGADNEKD